MSITKEELKQLVNKIQTNSIDELTNLIVKNSNEDVDPQEIKNEITEQTDIKDLQKRFKSAIDSIAEYMEGHKTHLEFKEVKENWLEGFNEFMRICSGKTPFKKIKNAESLQEAIGITEETFHHCYDAASALFAHQQFEKASDIFFLLAFLNEHYYSVWLSLGMCEQNCGRHDAALKAFSMAAINNYNSAEPFLYAALCCIDMHQHDEAKLYLDEANERIHKDPKENGKFKVDARNIKKLIK